MTSKGQPTINTNQNQGGLPPINNGYGGYGARPGQPPLAQGYNNPSYPAPYAMAVNYNPRDAAWRNRHSFDFYFCCSCSYKQIAPKTLTSYFCAQVTLDIVFFIFTIRSALNPPSSDFNYWWAWAMFILAVLTVIMHLVSIIFSFKAKGICKKFKYGDYSGSNFEKEGKTIKLALLMNFISNIIETVAFAVAICLLLYFSFWLDSFDHPEADAFSGLLLWFALSLIPFMLFFISQLTQYGKMKRAAQDIEDFKGINGGRGNSTHYGGPSNIPMNQLQL